MQFRGLKIYDTNPNNTLLRGKLKTIHFVISCLIPSKWVAFSFLSITIPTKEASKSREGWSQKLSWKMVPGRRFSLSEGPYFCLGNLSKKAPMALERRETWRKISSFSFHNFQQINPWFILINFISHKREHQPFQLQNELPCYRWRVHHLPDPTARQTPWRGRESTLPAICLQRKNQRFQENSNIPLQHTPDTQSAVYEVNLFILFFLGTWGMF